MILDKLFKQYKKGTKPSFGSRFATRMGNRLIGTPQQLGLDAVMPELQDTFYNRVADRWIPRDKKGQWIEGQKFVAEVRPAMEPVVAKAAAIGAITASLLFVSIGSGFAVVKAKVADASCASTYESAVAAGPGGADENVIKELQACQARGWTPNKKDN